MSEHLIAYEGEHMALAVMQEEYIRTYQVWANRRIGIEGTLQRPPYALEGGLEWVRALRAKKGEQEAFAILMREKGDVPYRYVGHTDISGVVWPAGVGTTGTVIGDPAGRERGIGTEAKLWLQYHAFQVMGLRKLSSNCKAFNGGSMGHLLKCGYKIVGRLRKHLFHEGEYVDEVLLECFREDWLPIWERYRESKQLPKLTDEQRAQVSKETGIEK